MECLGDLRTRLLWRFTYEQPPKRPARERGKAVPVGKVCPDQFGKRQHIIVGHATQCIRISDICKIYIAYGMAPSRPDLQHKLRRLAAIQSGHFSAAQALDLGYSYPTQSHHTKRGNWHRVARGIYRLPEWPVGDHDDLVRWTVWSRELGVVSHDTAISIRDLADVNPSTVHLTVPPGFRAKARGVILHHGKLADDDVWDREGYRITTPFRTAIDSAASDLSLEQLTEVVKNVSKPAPQAVPKQLRQAAERRGHREALRMERALRQAGLL